MASCHEFLGSAGFCGEPAGADEARCPTHAALLHELVQPNGAVKRLPPYPEGFTRD